MQINQNANQPIFSDGDQSTWPTAPPSADVVLKPIEDVMRRKRFIDRCSNALRDFATTSGTVINSNLTDFPAGYELYEQYKIAPKVAPEVDPTAVDSTQVKNITPPGNKKIKIDLLLYGHPSGNKFRTSGDFIPHLKWLLMDPSHDYKNCQCKICPAYHNRLEKAKGKRPASSFISTVSASASLVNPNLPASIHPTNTQSPLSKTEDIYIDESAIRARLSNSSSTFDLGSFNGDEDYKRKYKELKKKLSLIVGEVDNLSTLLHDANTKVDKLKSEKRFLYRKLKEIHTQSDNQTSIDPLISSPSSSSSSSSSEDSPSKLSPPKKRRRKDPNAPKRPPNAFMLFSEHEREVIRAEHDNVPITNMTKECSARWQALSGDEKQVFQDKYKIENERYVVELEEYNRRKAVDGHGMVEGERIVKEKVDDGGVDLDI